MSAPPAQLHSVGTLVDAIEDEMRRLELWANDPPPVADMASRVPFCYDTLKLWQWLQWILVPRMRLLLADGGMLPASSDIAPLAEVEFRRLQQDTQRLLDLIREFDRAIKDTGSRLPPG
jgi:uncharacterized protein YqcC (DUF446 family)